MIVEEEEGQFDGRATVIEPMKPLVEEEYQDNEEAKSGQDITDLFAEVPIEEEPKMSIAEKKKSKRQRKKQNKKTRKSVPELDVDVRRVSLVVEKTD